MNKILIALISLLSLTGITLFAFDTNQNTSFLQAANENSELFKIYQTWKTQHGKNTNGLEDQLRFTIFTENYNFIQTHNSQNSDLVLGLTQFADLTNKEYQDLMSSKITQIPDFQPTEIENDGTFKSIDWVSEGAVTDVKQQGFCGSCWAFSTIGGLEGLQAITTGKLESLSNQQVTSCAPEPFNGGCEGGNPLFAYMYTGKNGVESEANYPYTDEQQEKDASPCKFNPSNVVFQNKFVGLVDSNSPAQMNAQLQKQPLSVAVDSLSIFFQFYTDGVLKSEYCGTKLTHAVTLVGYSSEDNAWTIKNSWGTGWGNKGFAKILNTEGEGVCGINMTPTFPTAN